MLPVKCVTLGDGCAGKTSILRLYADNFLLDEYPPTVCEEYLAHATTSNGTSVMLRLCDTAGLNIRPFFYVDTEILLLCFSVADPNSLENIRLRWLPEIKHYCPNVPLILVGTKIDLRRHRHSKCLSLEQGMDLAKKIKALEYMECSARSGLGVKEIFQVAASSAMERRTNDNGKNSSRKCCLM
uniref:Uncharacterized protein n=1 Tax=Stomoxys calcitrans TaxID=35570 RepID=A0A1I8QB91_STOCA